jgi:hypothetical protein
MCFPLYQTQKKRDGKKSRKKRLARDGIRCTRFGLTKKQEKQKKRQISSSKQRKFRKRQEMIKPADKLYIESNS